MTKKSPLTRLHSGDFNSLLQEWQADGTVIITLSKHKEAKAICFRVKDLYGPDEKEVPL